MANIKVTLDYQINDGMSLTFKAPCDCTEVTGLIVYYPVITDDGSTTTSKTFTFKDAHNNNLTSIDNLFTTDAYVKVVLNINQNYAYIQNADTNSYLEGKFTTINANLEDKAPAYTYGTTDLTAGTSSLETGKLYFVYE